MVEIFSTIPYVIVPCMCVLTFLLYSTLLYSTLLYSTLLYSTLRYSTPLYYICMCISFKTIFFVQRTAPLHTVYPTTRWLYPTGISDFVDHLPTELKEGKGFYT